MRRSLLASVFTSALALPGAARAQSIAYPTGIPAGGAILQNATGAATPSLLTTFGMGFARGALPSGSGLAATIGGTATPVQLDVHSVWPDGSARWASETLVAPALAAGASTALVNTTTGSPASGTLSWPNPTLTVALLGSTVDLGTPARSSSDAWLAGPVANERRVDVPVPGDTTGAMHLVADITCGAGAASCSADVQVRRDVASVQAASSSVTQTVLAPLSYTATLTLNGTATVQAVASQNQYQDWHLVVGAASPVNVQHDVAGLIAAGLVPAYDLANPVSTASGSNYATDAAELASAGFGAPLASNGLQVNMETTGGRPDIGITTAADAIWLRTGDDAARRYALAQADADGSVPWNFWIASLGRWADPVDYPGLYALTSQGNYDQYFTQGLPAQDTTNTPSTQPWDIHTSHAPNVAYIPALLTGSRWYHDLQQSQALAATVIDNPANRDNDDTVPYGSGDNIFRGGSIEVRSMAWTYREVAEATALSAPGSTALAHLGQILSDSWAWWSRSENQPGWTSSQGAVATFIPGRYAEPWLYAPWQQDYFASAVNQGAKLGDAGAVAALPTITSNLVDATVAQTGWDPRDSIVNEYPFAAISSPYTPYTTWAASEAAALTAGGDNHDAPATTSTGNYNLGSPGDYGSLRRMTLIDYLRLHPGDATATAGLEGLLGDGNPFVSYGNGLENEDLALPSGITPNGSWAAAAAAASSYQATYTGTGSSAASRSLAATEAQGEGASSGSGTTSASSGSSSAPTTPATSSIIGHWTFSEGTGTTTADSSGNGLAGTLSGSPSWVSGATGAALTFSGTAVDTLPTTTAIAVGSAFSIGARVFITDGNEGRAVTGDVGGSYYGAPSLLVYGAQVYLASEGTGYPCAGPQVPLNAETRILVTVTPGTGCAFYLNGSQTGTVSSTATFAAQPSPSLGNGNNLTMPFVNGHLSDVEIWNYALTPAAAEAITGTALDSTATNAALPGPVTGLAAGAVTSSTVAVTWSAPGTGGTATGYVVAPSAGAAVTLTGTGTTLTGLAAGTSYTIAVAATNATGTGTPSSVTATTAATSASTGTSVVGSIPVSSVLGSILSNSTTPPNGLSLPYPGEPLAVPIGGLHYLTADGVVTAAASSAITLTASTVPGSCTAPTSYYIVGARTGSQLAGAGGGAPGYCNDARQVVLTATGLAPTF